MKFTQIALIVIMMTLSLSAVASLNIIPNGTNSNPLRTDLSTLTGLNNQSYTINESTGEISCPGNASTSDIMCKVYYLDEQEWGGARKITDVSDTFGFSDIISGANMVTSILSLSFFRIGYLYDTLVLGTQCADGSYDPLMNRATCNTNHPLKKIKYMFIIPIYFIYFIAFFEVVTGRNLGGDK